MGIFGQSTPFDAEIEKATSETNTNEDWTVILDVCDKVSSNPRNAKECLKSIMKRMGHPDPHVVIQALTLLDACANNCGKSFHLEIASREFENEYRRLLSKAQQQVSLKMRQILKNWAENDFKNDPQLNLIPSFYHKLRSEGYDFSNLNEKPAKSASTIAALKDPNVVSSQQEEEDIAKAIELSLKEAKNSPKKQLTTSSSVPTTAASSLTYGRWDDKVVTSLPVQPSLYPSFSGSSGSLGSITSAVSSQTSQSEHRKVRALYDFEAAEENELTFLAGEIIHVIDDSDPNWWKGYNSRGEGLFPSNFATADISAETDRIINNQKSQRSVKFEDDAIKKDEDKTETDTEAVNMASAAGAVADNAAKPVIEIDEAKVDRLLHLLHEANPEDPSQDTDEMLRLEQEVHHMGPLIDAELERVDRKHAQLTQLSSDLVDAINLYHTLMRDDRATIPSTASGYMLGMGPQPPSTASGFPNPQSMYYGYPPYNMPAPSHTQQNYHMLAGAAPTVSMQQYPSISAVNNPPSSIPQVPQTVANHHMSAPAVSSVGNVAAYNPPQLHGPPQMIPMQFQNGRLQASGGGAVVPPPIVGPQIQQHPPSQQTNLYASSQHQQLPHQQQPQTYQMPTQQQQQQHSQILSPPRSQLPGGQAPSTTSASQLPMPQHQPPPSGQFISQQHQQQTYASALGQQYPPMTNGPYIGGPGIGAARSVDSIMCNPGMMPHHQAPLPHHNTDFSHQMAAAINQPVTQNFLVHNEQKNSIPIYQQQR